MSPSTMVQTQCVCGAAPTYATSVEEKDGISVARCQACGVMRTFLRPVDYSSLYTEGQEYHSGRCQERYGYQTYQERFEHDYTIANAHRVPKYLRQLRSLDVGCANGAFVIAMADRGFDAVGLEINPTMAQWTAARIEEPVFTSWRAIEDWYGAEAFDLITYHDVFEHVVDPVEELATIRRHLRGAGLLVLDVPDGAEVFGIGARAPHHHKPEQHLWYWEERTLVRLLAQQGFVTDDVDRPIVGKLVISARKCG